jgi:hypothetical protein
MSPELKIVLLSAALIVFPIAVVLIADWWEARISGGRFDCGCPWPVEDDGPLTEVCACGVTHRFDVWTDWRGRLRDVWEPVDDDLTPGHALDRPETGRQATTAPAPVSQDPSDDPDAPEGRPLIHSATDREDEQS